MHEIERPAADIAFRRRCLTVNSGIYARRHGEAALALLPENAAVRRRLAAEMEWLRSEAGWTSHDERRIAALCAEILRHARRAPEHLELLWWHAARLRELLNQYAAIAALERTLTRNSVWHSVPAPAPRKARRPSSRRARR